MSRFIAKKLDHRITNTAVDESRRVSKVSGGCCALVRCIFDLFGSRSLLPGSVHRGFRIGPAQDQLNQRQSGETANSKQGLLTLSHTRVSLHHPIFCQAPKIHRKSSTTTNQATSISKITKNTWQSSFPNLLSFNEGGVGAFSSIFEARIGGQILVCIKPDSTFKQTQAEQRRGAQHGTLGLRWDPYGIPMGSIMGSSPRLTYLFTILYANKSHEEGV